MGHIRKSGQSSLWILGPSTDWTLGANNWSLGSNGKTKYTLNQNGSQVTLKYTLGGTPFTKTLRAGDDIKHEMQLGRNGSTSYNMGPGGTKVIKYSLDPGGDVIEVNGRLKGKDSSASYTLGPGSSSKVNATLGKGSKQSYDVGTGGSSKITTTIDGETTEVNLGPGDSAETTIDYGAVADLETTSTYDPDVPPQETIDYNVGEEGSTDTTFGDETWQVWLFQPYNVTNKVDYNPICVVMPQGEYTPGCPGRLPSFIQDNGDYAEGTNCRYILVGSAHKNSAGGWEITQNAIGTLTFPTDDKQVYMPTPDPYPDPYVNQYEVKVDAVDIDGLETIVLKIARGGNIWNPSTDAEQHPLEKRVDNITVDPRSGYSVYGGTETYSPWADDGGYVIMHGTNAYVYAFRVTYNYGADTDFYIYLSDESDLEQQGNTSGFIPPGITPPTGEYRVDGFKIADVVWNGTESGVHVFDISQRVVGAITWPAYTPPVQYQPFQVVMAKPTEDLPDEDCIQIVKGDIIWTNSRWQSNPPPSGGTETPTLQGEAKKVWVYPDGSVTEGTDYTSPFVNAGGRFHLEKTSVYGVYIIGNQDSMAAGSPYGNVTLAIIADGSEADTKSKPFNSGYMGRNWISAFVSQPFFTVDETQYYQKNFDQNWLWNYNCQRYLVAKVYWNEVEWVIEQRLLGPVTIPNDLIFDGCRDMPAVGPGESWPFEYADEQGDWDGNWAGYTKDGNPDYCTVIVRPYP